MTNVFFLLFISLCFSQFTVRYVREKTTLSSWRADFKDCSSYCNLTNAVCWYPITVVTNIEQILIINYTPGICVCYDGYGGPNCSYDVSNLQNITGKHINYNCTYQIKQLDTYPNGTSFIYDQCPCALRYTEGQCPYGDCNPGGNTVSPKGFCMSDLINRPTCFCYGDWTGRNCELYFPTWIRAVKDTIGYVILNTLFILLLIPSSIVLILVCLPPKGKTWSQVNKFTFTLKFLSALFITITLCLKAIGSISEWAWQYENIITIFFYLVGIVLNISAFFLMITLWSQLKDISTRNEKNVKIKFGIGIGVVIVQLIFAVIFFIPYLAVYGVAYTDFQLELAPQWFTFVFSIVLFIEFFFAGLGFLIFGLRTFYDLKKVDPDLKFESLKFTKFMTAICVVFASQSIWTLLLGLDTVCDCLGGTSFFCFLIIHIHEFIYMTLFLYLLFDWEHFKSYFLPCIKNKESE